MTGSDLHNRFMARAIELAKQSIASDEGGPFGAVVVRGDDIVSEGANCVTSALDPTAHAEIVAIRNACSTLEVFSLEGCQLYTTCEPCPMCLSAVYWARIDQITFAASRQQAADAGFDDAFLYREVALPIPERTIPMIRVDDDDAQGLFDLWQAKEDKTPY